MSAVNRSADYKLTYDRWISNPLNWKTLTGFRLEIKKKFLTITADRIFFDFDLNQSLREKRFIFACKMDNVAFNSKTAVPQLADAQAKAFGSDQKYENVEFTLRLDKDIFNLTAFNAVSPDIRMKGEYSYFRKKGEIAVDLKISFSPAMALTFEKNIRKNVLSLEDNGWYSTVISYKGNPALLKALYSLTM